MIRLSCLQWNKSDLGIWIVHIEAKIIDLEEENKKKMFEYL